VRLAERHGDRIVVDFAMRYGNPSTPSVIARLQAAGCDRIVFFPLYPQYSAPTTATANDQAFRVLMELRWQPAIRTVPGYHDHPIYIEALAQSGAASPTERRPDVLVTSYHRMPERYLKGDLCHCHKTTRLLRDRLGGLAGGVADPPAGRMLKPTRSRRWRASGRSGGSVTAPVFAADASRRWKRSGNPARLPRAGGEFIYIPCLNAVGAWR
jgi:ferrochelatase